LIHTQTLEHPSVGHNPREIFEKPKHCEKWNIKRICVYKKPRYPLYRGWLSYPRPCPDDVSFARFQLFYLTRGQHLLYAARPLCCSLDLDRSVSGRILIDEELKQRVSRLSSSQSGTVLAGAIRQTHFSIPYLNNTKTFQNARRPNSHALHHYIHNTVCMYVCMYTHSTHGIYSTHASIAHNTRAIYPLLLYKHFYRSHAALVVTITLRSPYDSRAVNNATAPSQ